MPGDGKGWALDEDRRQMREALSGIVKETSLAKAQIIHTPFWQGLSAVAPEILEKTFVIAHADNPPFFYLKQPEFLLGQQHVDLWVARSQEALEQFRVLQLPVEYIPYTIDEKLFFPISDKKSIRKNFGIPENAYVIANFHRDTEGADLTTPKLQKAPELMLSIFKKLQQRGISFHVLLAGPRRHWLRNALTEEKIPFTFVGKGDVAADDFGVNILNRSTLNELTNAADLYLIPSRWEGGPQSAMEAAACRCKVLSTPLGVARDILEPVSLYRSASDAADRIEDDIKNDSLQVTVQPQWERWYQSHTTASMAKGLQQLYETLSRMGGSLSNYQINFSAKNFFEIMKPDPTSQRKQFFHRLQRRFLTPSLPKSVGWNHELGKNKDLDEILLGVSRALQILGIKQHCAMGSGIEIIGSPTEDLPSAKKDCQRLQWIVPTMSSDLLLKEASLIAPSVQDVINSRRDGFLNSAIAIPFPLMSKEETSEEPFVVEAGDLSSSLKIWRAMAAGRPIVYPENSAYYEQVFHGGLSYKTAAILPAVVKAARESAFELRALAKLPTRNDATKALKQLLTLLHQS